jgi:hypothetical protein
MPSCAIISFVIPPNLRRRVPMARKPTEIVPTSLRIRESLRRRVEQAAAQRAVSFNYELTSRVQDSFDREDERALAAIVRDLSQIEERIGKRQHALEMQGDLIRASENLIAANKQQDPEAIAAAVIRVEEVIKMIDADAVLALRRARTTGGGTP